MDIRKIIKEEIKKIFESDYPAGAQFDTAAPYNEPSANEPIQKAKDNKFGVVWYGDNSGITLLKDNAGNLYAFNTESVDMEEYAPYASREEELMGHEDGIPDVEYGEWELDGDVVENYINDNLDSISIGGGLDDFESGSNMALVDDSFKKYLIGLSKYIKNNKEAFDKTINGSVDEIKSIADKLVDTPTMDTPEGTLFVMSMGEGKKKIQ